MQQLGEKRIKIIRGNGQSVSGPLTSKKGFAFFGLFTSPRAEARGKNTATLLKEPVLKNSNPHVSRDNLTAVKSWVALEEKIVHDYKEHKAVQLKSVAPLLKTPAKQPLPGSSDPNSPEKKAPSPAISKKESGFSGFFNFFKAEAREKHPPTVLKEPVLKSPILSVTQADLTALNKLTALEEKVVRDFNDQKTAQSKDAVSLPKAPGKQPLFTTQEEQKPAQFKSAPPSTKTQAKQPPPAFETFSTQTAVASSSSFPKPKEPLRGFGKKIGQLGRSFIVLGWLVAGVLMFLYVQEIFQNREASKKLVQLQSEKEQLGRSYAELGDASKQHTIEMKWMKGQLRDISAELKTAKAEKIDYERNFEKRYLERLKPITSRYEAELAALRGTVQTQNAIVSALKAQSQAFDKIMDQAGMSALSGAAAGLSQEPFSRDGTSASQGEVTSVNERQGSVVISIGAPQGARSGSWITISRGGIGLASGRIDRVYPTMSVAMVRDASMLKVIRAGDNVSFS